MKSNHPPQPDRPIYKPLQRNGYVCRGLTSMENIYQEQEIYNTNLTILYIDCTMNNSEIPLYRWPGSRKCYLIVIFSFSHLLQAIIQVPRPSFSSKQIQGVNVLKTSLRMFQDLQIIFIISTLKYTSIEQKTPRDIGRDLYVPGHYSGGSRTSAPKSCNVFAWAQYLLWNYYGPLQ